MDPKGERSIYGVEAHPNPNPGRFRVRYELPGDEGRLEMRDMQGRPVLERKLRGRKGEFSVDRSDLSPGIYLLQLHSGKGGG